MRGAVEQIVLVIANRRQPAEPLWRDTNVAGHAGAAASTKCEQFVENGVADHPITEKPALYVMRPALTRRDG